MFGSCLCGEINYEVDCFSPEITNCHCGMCRKFHGAAFATYGKVQLKDFRWLEGQKLLTIYPSSSNAVRGFLASVDQVFTIKSPTRKINFLLLLAP